MALFFATIKRDSVSLLRFPLLSCLGLLLCNCYLCIAIKVKLANLVEGDSKAPFSIAITPFPGLLHFTLDPHLIVLSAKQGSIKYHFKSLCYDLTWD